MPAAPKYLVTGAGGGVGGVGRMVVDDLLTSRQAVRAMVHRDDARADALRESGAHVVVGDLTNPVDVAAALDGVTRVFFSMSVSASYLEATAVVCSLAAELGRSRGAGEHVTDDRVADDTDQHAESHQQRSHWLAEHIVDWSPVPSVQIRPTVFLENPLFTLLAADSDTRQGSARIAFRRRPNFTDRCPATLPMRSAPFCAVRPNTSAPCTS